MSSYIIGIDIGGTSIKAGLLTTKGKIIKTVERKTNAHLGTSKVIATIISAIEHVHTKKVSKIGVGCPGPLNVKTGVIGNAVNLPFNNTPLRTILQKKFKVPVVIDNDARCFALAQALYGNGKNHGTVVGITLGTGVGCGIVIHKEMVYGRGNASEAGHATIKFDGPKSADGNAGSIESYIGARVLSKLYGEKIEPHELSERAAKKDKKAIRAYKQMGFLLGVSVANILYLLDPDVVIIGGHVSASWPYFSPMMKKTVKKRYFQKACPIVRSTLTHAGIRGAAALVI